MTRVVHCKRQPYDIYIGRPSILGNPFVIGKDGNRQEVIAKFVIYAEQRMKSDKAFAIAIRNCKDKTLGCWCKPLQCHGDVIAKLTVVEVVEDEG